MIKPMIHAVVGVWLLSVAAGFTILWNYEHAAGAKGAPPERWPATTTLQRCKDRATLVMLVHPRCPCTRATIGELQHIMARHGKLVDAQLLFHQPAGCDRDWVLTDLWKTAAAIPGVTPIADASGRQAQLFRAETSGHTLLFDARGNLLFSGGITASRGHSGDNYGRAAIERLLRAEQPTTRAVANHFVFGCQLTNEDVTN